MAPGLLLHTARVCSPGDQAGSFMPPYRSPAPSLSSPSPGGGHTAMGVSLQVAGLAPHPVSLSSRHRSGDADEGAGRSAVCVQNAIKRNDSFCTMTVARPLRTRALPLLVNFKLFESHLLKALENGVGNGAPHGQNFYSGLSEAPTGPPPAKGQGHAGVTPKAQMAKIATDHTARSHLRVGLACAGDRGTSGEGLAWGGQSARTRH